LATNKEAYTTGCSPKDFPQLSEQLQKIAAAQKVAKNSLYRYEGKKLLFVAPLAVARGSVDVNFIKGRYEPKAYTVSIRSKSASLSYIF
jgi:hypothetical protein